MNSNHPEQPRSEPEIIPPALKEPFSVNRTSYEQRHTHRIYVTKLGPFTTLILMLIFTAVVAILSLILIGTFLIWIPLFILLIAIGLISAWWQRMFRR